MLGRLRRPARGGKEVVQASEFESFAIARVKSHRLSCTMFDLNHKILDARISDGYHGVYVDALDAFKTS